MTTKRRPSRSIGRLFVPLLKRGFVYAGGVKAFRLISERGTVQFLDKDTRRALRRGSPFVEVKIKQLCELLSEDSEPEIFYDSEGEAKL